MLWRDDFEQQVAASDFEDRSWVLAQCRADDRLVPVHRLHGKVTPSGGQLQWHTSGEGDARRHELWVARRDLAPMQLASFLARDAERALFTFLIHGVFVRAMIHWETIYHQPIANPAIPGFVFAQTPLGMRESRPLRRQGYATHVVDGEFEALVMPSDWTSHRVLLGPDGEFKKWVTGYDDGHVHLIPAMSSTAPYPVMQDDRPFWSKVEQALKAP